MLVWRRNNIFEEFDSKFLELYELGIKHGLKLDYLDTRCYSNGDYYMASAPFSDIEKNYDLFLKYGNISNSWLNCMVKFLYRRLVYQTLGEDRILNEYLTRSTLFQNIYNYSLKKWDDLFVYQYEREDLCNEIAEKVRLLKK